MTTNLKYPLSEDEISILPKVWEFYLKFINNDILLNNYRKYTIKLISSEYSSNDFLRYEAVIDKLYWNLQHELAKIWINDENLIQIPYSLVLSNKTSYSSEKELGELINEKQLKTTYYRSFVNKLIIVDRKKKIIHAKKQESSIGMFNKNYFNLLGSQIMSSKQLYEKIIQEPNLIKTMKIPLPKYYHEIDYGFPNFSFCEYNINDVNDNDGRQTRLDRIIKMYYSGKDSEKNWFKLL